ncbi:MAG: hypothetical protein LIO42_06995 [Oscillospiraceae bacterium]|nr:hypothetical protein [Oscillospiraceae bacterium]
MSSAAFAINYNLFCYPMGYFEEHTAEELKITEEERLVFIKKQTEGQR